MLPGDATQVTLGVDEKKNCKKKNSQEEESEALKAFKIAAKHTNFFVYPHHGTETDGSHCLFDILIEELKAAKKVLEGVIFSAGLFKTYKHPSRFAMEKVYAYYKNIQNDYNDKKWQRLLYY